MIELKKKTKLIGQKNGITRTLRLPTKDSTAEHFDSFNALFKNVKQTAFWNKHHLADTG